MAIANNNTNQVASRYRIKGSFSRMKVNTRTVVLTSDTVQTPLADFTATFMEEGQIG